MRIKFFTLATALSISWRGLLSAAPCSYSISPASASFSSSGGSSNFSVTVGSSCGWTATPTTSWIHTSSSGMGNGTVNYTVDANPNSGTRNGGITVGTKTFTISQTGVPPTLASGLDTSNLVWTTASDYPWQVVTDVTHDGSDAAVSGNKFVPASASWVQTTVTGPGTIGFWWKVDSDVTPTPPDDPLSFDYLEFVVNDVQQDFIMGQIGWNYREFALGPGANTLVWQYVKDSQFNTGNDSAWLDQVTWSPGAPISLATALDTCGVSWDTAGSDATSWSGTAQGWSGQTNVTHDGKSAARSGTINISECLTCPTQESWMQSVVSGVSNVSFWWKVSSQTNFDFLEFYTNDVLVKRISGEVNWQSNFFNLATSNTYTLKWRYFMTNGIYAAQGQEAAWVDQVVFSPSNSAAPVVSISGANPLVVECHGTFSDPGATAQDGCSGAALTVVTNGTVNANATGAYLLSYVATNSSGTTTTNFRTVNVVDTTPPVVTLTGSNLIVLECHDAFNDPGATAQDTCAGTLLVTTNGLVNPNSPGTYILKYIATDPSGNSTTNTRTVQVLDTTPPQITVAGLNPMTVECHDGFTDPGATAQDTCAGPLSVTTNNPVNPNVTGSYVIQYVAKDPSGNSTTNTRTVNVVDTTPPQITLLGTNSMTVECHGSFVDPGATALDTCAGILSVTTNNPVNPNALGIYTIQYIAKDPSGNGATNTRTVTVVDTTPPQITANGLNPMTVECHGPFSDPGATAADNCAGTLTVSTNGVVDPNTPGSYTIFYSASDPSGNGVTNSRTVNVVDTTPPSIVFVQSNLVLNADVNCQALLPDLTVSNYFIAVDSCSSVTVTQMPTAGTLLALGTNAVILSAFDSTGNVTTFTNPVIVTDLTPPSIIAPGIVVAAADPGQCSASQVSLGSPIVSDNCELGTVTNNAPASFPIGTNLVVWTATDTHGNSTNAIQTVVVNDLQAPAITSPPDVAALVDVGQNYASGVSLGSPITSDNCGIGNLTNDAPPHFTLGTNLVTWTVMDVHGNSNTAVQQVIVTRPPDLPHGIASIINNHNGTLTLNFTGAANVQYWVQTSTDFSNWQTVQTNLADANGAWSYVELSTSSAARRLYRSLRP